MKLFYLFDLFQTRNLVALQQLLCWERENKFTMGELRKKT